MSAPTVDVDADRDARSAPHKELSPADLDRPSRTAAATAARRLAKAEKLCAELVARLDSLPDPLLGALVAMVMAECQRRAGTAPEAVPAAPGTVVAPVRFSDPGDAR